MRSVLFFLAFTILALFTGTARAQSLGVSGEQPAPPIPLQEAVAGGAQIYYLGEYQGLQGWALIRQGTPEFYYATEDNTALVMGLLFDGEGEMITSGQLAELQYREGDDMFAMTEELSGGDTAATPVLPEATRQAYVPLTPAQEMYVDLQASNWLTFGDNGQYEVFAFIDPDCPHCQAFIREIQSPYLSDGLIKLRVIPVGFTGASLRRAALLLASSDPAERMLRYAQGESEVLSPPEGINVSAVAKNRSVMEKWGFDATPTIVYKAGNGEIRIIRGKPKDYSVMMQDLAATR